MTKPFTLLVKPASADCNLRCEYCFYLEHCAFYPETKRHRMSDDVLEKMISSYLATKQPMYQFGWQGGEPTLMGLDFFKRVVDLQQKHGQSGANVGNGLQTNCTLIDDEWAAHLAEYSFLTGASIDGPEELHDKYRKTIQGSGSHADVLRGIECLRRQGAEYNTLTLVNEANVREASTVYHYLCELGSLFHQYIPCVETDEERHMLPFSTSPEAWGEFLCRIFDIWYAADTRRVSIRLFDAILGLLVDRARNVCHFGSDCRQYFVVEYNGDIFPCDFFVDKSLKLGNITRDTWQSCQESKLYERFGTQKRQWNERCDHCRYSWICAGDCLKHRLGSYGDDPRRLSSLCRGWKMFYSHSLSGFEKLAAEIKAERRRNDPPPFLSPLAADPGKPPGRNDPCPCGSGRKYKKCCGR